MVVVVEQRFVELLRVVLSFLWFSRTVPHFAAAAAAGGSSRAKDAYINWPCLEVLLGVLFLLWCVVIPHHNYI